MLSPPWSPGRTSASSRGRRGARPSALSGCFTGERPRLAEGATATGDPAADAVLALLDTAGDATFTGEYRSLTRFGNITTPVTVVQTGRPAGRRPSARSGSSSTGPTRRRATSTTARARHHRRARISDLQLTPGLLCVERGGPPAAGHRAAGGPTRASTETIAGQPATCVVVPVTGGESTYCALDTGPLARLDAADLSIELTQYSPTADETQFEQPG